MTEKSLHECCGNCYTELIVLEAAPEDIKHYSDGYQAMAQVCDMIDIDIDTLDIDFALCSECLQTYVISSQISLGGVVDSIYNE